MIRIFNIFILTLLFNFLYAQEDSLKHTIELGSRYEKFDNNTDRTFVSLQYGYNFKLYNQINKIFYRIVYQNRSRLNVFQHILDYYPEHKNGYWFYSIRYSKSYLFPTIWTASEYYRNFNKNKEFSIGLRYIQALGTYNIVAITGTYGMYYGNFYSYIRPMINFLKDGIAWSGQINTRYYSGDGNKYIEGQFLYGVDNSSLRPINSIENSFGLDTYLFRIKGNVLLKNNINFSIGFDYSGIFIPKINGDTNELNIFGSDINVKKHF